VRSWTIKNGLRAPQAASAIHSDFEKKFINVDVMNYVEFKKIKENAALKYEKLMKKEGKDFLVKDGDILHFKCKK
jgi:ribosome-binding ATPase YchF (GTP1/OBG family)